MKPSDTMFFTSLDLNSILSLRPAGKIVIIKKFSESFSKFFRIAAKRVCVVAFTDFKFDILRGFIWI